MTLNTYADELPCIHFPQFQFIPMILNSFQRIRKQNSLEFKNVRSPQLFFYWVVMLNRRGLWTWSPGAVYERSHSMGWWALSISAVSERCNWRGLTVGTPGATYERDQLVTKGGRWTWSYMRLMSIVSACSKWVLLLCAVYEDGYWVWLMGVVTMWGWWACLLSLWESRKSTFTNRKVFQSFLMQDPYRYWLGIKYCCIYFQMSKRVDFE